MLKRKQYFTYYNILVPSFLVVEGYQMYRLKTKKELKQDISYFFKKLFAKFKKKTIYKSNWINTRSLSSFDYHIQEKGGIVDQEGNVHTTSSSYKNYLKANDLVIKDWSDGSNKKQMQLCDRSEVANIVNKHI